MAITKEKKKELISQYRRHKSDTSSPEVQISVLTERINELTNHLAKNSKDYQSQRGLLMLIGKRRRHLNYLERKNLESFKRVQDKLTLKD